MSIIWQNSDYNPFNITLDHNHTNLNYSEPSFVEHPLLRHSVPWTITLVAAYVLIFLFGIFGNLIVVLVITLKPQMKTVTNMLILNLAVADIFVSIFCVVPTLLANIFTCKFSQLMD